MMFMNSVRDPGAETESTMGGMMWSGAMALTRMPWRSSGENSSRR